MTVGELRKALDGVPDDLLVVVEDMEIGDLDEAIEAGLIQTYRRQGVGLPQGQTRLWQTHSDQEATGRAFRVN